MTKHLFLGLFVSLCFYTISSCSKPICNTSESCQEIVSCEKTNCLDAAIHNEKKIAEIVENTTEIQKEVTKEILLEKEAHPEIPKGKEDSPQETIKGCLSGCKASETCWANEICIEKNKTCNNNLDCASNETCVEEVEGNFCWKLCDLKKNMGGNPQLIDRNIDCDGGQGLCHPLQDGRGVCDLRKPVRNEGESCELGDSKQAGYHFCKTGFSCFYNVCSKSCDLSLNVGGNSKKADLNPACDSGKKQCTPLLHSDGACDLRRSTREEGQSCELFDFKEDGFQKCKEGLTCMRFRCFATCGTASQLEPTQCKSNEWCRSRNGKIPACTRKCDPKEGELQNKNCKSYEACVAHSGEYSPGYCYPLADQRNGNKQLNEKCSVTDPSFYCDASQNLFCNYPTCLPACDPTKGELNNPLCTKNQKCVVSTLRSHLGGKCQD